MSLNLNQAVNKRVVLSPILIRLTLLHTLLKRLRKEERGPLLAVMDPRNAVRTEGAKAILYCYLNVYLNQRNPLLLTEKLRDISLSMRTPFTVLPPLSKGD